MNSNAICKITRNINELIIFIISLMLFAATLKMFVGLFVTVDNISFVNNQRILFIKNEVSLLGSPIFRYELHRFRNQKYFEVGASIGR